MESSCSVVSRWKKDPHQTIPKQIWDLNTQYVSASKMPRCFIPKTKTCCWDETNKNFTMGWAGSRKKNCNLTPLCSINRWKILPQRRLCGQVLFHGVYIKVRTVKRLWLQIWRAPKKKNTETPMQKLLFCVFFLEKKKKKETTTVDDSEIWPTSWYGK